VPRPVPEGVDPEARELLDALAHLGVRQRTALVLRFYADLSEADVARALGCRPGTAKSLVHRGLRRLEGMIER
jgi:RNA polymerase sigma factor (sigma-70 family)